MAIPYDASATAAAPTSSDLEPAMTLRPFGAEDLGRALDPKTPPPAEAMSPDDLGRLIRGDFNINVAAPAPRDLDAARAMQDKLNYESTYNPPGPTVSPYRHPIEAIGTFAPEGTNPRINYGPAPTEGEPQGSLINTALIAANPITAALAHPWDVAEGISKGAYQGLAAVRKDALGLASMVTGNKDLRDMAAASDYASRQMGNLGDGSLVGGFARGMSENVTSMAPAMLAGMATGEIAPALGVGTKATEWASRITANTMFGLGAAGSGYTDAEEAGYAHPDLYAIGSGVIAFGAGFLPGGKGRNAVLQAADMTASKAWADYLQELVAKYGSREFLQTHGGAGAIQGAIQSAAQGLLNKATIDPSLTWTDFAKDALKSAGMGALIGEGFGALHQHSNNEALKQQFQDFYDSIDESKLRGGQPGALEMRYGEQQLPYHQAEGTPWSGAEPPKPYVPDPSLYVTRHQQPPEDLDDDSSIYQARERNKTVLPKAAPEPEPTPPVETPIAPVTPATPAQVPATRVETSPNAPENRIADLSTQIHILAQSTPEETAIQRRVFNQEEQPGDIERLHELQGTRARQIAAASAEIERLQRPAPPVAPPVVPNEPAAPDFVSRVKQAVNSGRIVPVGGGIWTPITGDRPAVFAKVGNGVLPFYRSAHGTGGAKEAGTWHPFFGVGNNAWVIKGTNEQIASKYGSSELKEVSQWLDHNFNWPRERDSDLIYNSQQSPLSQAGPKVMPGEAMRHIFGETQFEDIHSKGNSSQPHIDAILDRLGLKPKIEIPPTPLQQATLPPKPIEGRLPNKGESVPLGNEFHVTRNNLGKVVIQKEGDSRTLATLKTNDASKITPEAILADLQDFAKGIRPKYWDFNTQAPNNPLLRKGTTEAQQEALHGDPEQVMQQVAGETKSTPEGRSIAGAIQTGALPHDLAVAMVGAVKAKEGPKAIAEELHRQVKAASKPYLAGTLLERTEVGEAGQQPEETFDKESGEKLSSEAISKLYPDKDALASRVLQIISGNKRVDLQAGEAEKVRQVTPPQDEEGHGERDPSAAARTVAAKEAFEDDQTRKAVTDDMLKTGGKIDPAKQRLLAEAGDIHDALLRGEDADYDKGIANLMKLGFTKPEAEHWLESESTSEAPPPKGGGFSTTMAREMTKDKPYGINLVKGNIPVDALRAKIKDTIEGRILTDLGLGKFLEGKTVVSKSDLASWVADHGPKVEVKVITAGEPGKQTDESRELADLQHAVIDMLPEQVRAPVRNYVREYMEDPESADTISWFNQAMDDYRDSTGSNTTDGSREDLGVFRRNLRRYAALAAELATDTPIYEEPTGARYASIGPKDPANMPHYFELLVKKPQKHSTREKIESLGGEYPHDAADWYFEHPHFPEDPNVLGFGRGYVETLPSGEKALHVIEVQSDWEHTLRAMQNIEDRSYYTGNTREEREQQRAEVMAERWAKMQDPLLKHYEYLVLKAMIARAKELGVTHIIISDAETAMMSEGHDRQRDNFRNEQNFPELNNLEVTVPGTDTKGRIAGGQVLLNQDGDYVVIIDGRYSGSHVFDLDQIQEVPQSTKYSIKRTLDQVAKERVTNWQPAQSKGMRLHYDGTLSRIMEELSGSKGTRVELGEHYKAMSDDVRDPEAFNRALDEGPVTGMTDEELNRHLSGTRSPRPGLVFKNPDGTPKTTVTGRDFDISKAVAALGEGKPLSLLTKRATLEAPGPHTELAHSIGPLRSANVLDLKPERRTLYEGHGLLANNLAEPVRIIAAGDGPYASLAQYLMRYSTELGKVALGNVGGRSENSYYSADLHEVKVRADLDDLSDLQEHTLHEAIHALLMRRMAVLGPDSPEMQDLTKIFEAVKAARSAAQELPGDTGQLIDYGLSSPHEFIDMAVSNPEMRGFMQGIKVEGGSLWRRFINWVSTTLTGKPYFTALSETRKVWDAVMSKGEVSRADWLAARDPSTDSVAKYPEIRTLNQYRRLTDYKGDELPTEERTFITRNATANNQWIREPDIQAVLSTVPEEAQSILKPIFGARQLVLDTTRRDPGGALDSSYKAMMADNSIPDRRKSEISLSVLHNLLEFQGQKQRVFEALGRHLDKLDARLDNLDKGLNEADLKRQATMNAVDELVSDFKNRILMEKEKSASDAKITVLNQQLKMAKDFQGRRTATDRLVNWLADAVPLEVLLDETKTPQMHEIIRAAVEQNPGDVPGLNISEDTMRQAAIILANSNNIREQLLNLKLSKDAGLLHLAAELDDSINADLKARDLNKALAAFGSKAMSYGTQEQKVRAVYRTLYKEKSRLLRNVGKYAQAARVLEDVTNSKSFRELYGSLAKDNKAMQPMRVLPNNGGLEFTHAITREPVTINTGFGQDTEIRNVRNYMDLIDGAKAYLAMPDRQSYDPLEAEFWKTIIANASFYTDPTIGINARKLVPAKLDPWKLTKLAGGVLQIPDHALEGVGGRQAVEAQVGLQAISTVLSQVAHLKHKNDAPIDRTANAAAKQHSMSVDVWHREVLNPLIASRQTTGYKPLKAGDKTIYGHTINPLDELAFRTQLEADREIVDVATKGRGNPSVGFNPSKVTFDAPYKDAEGRPVKLARQIAASGPDTMSRRLGFWTRSLASDWFDNTSVPARTKFMDENFLPVVIGHIDNVGAPDYTIKSSQKDLYKDALKQHAREDFTNVADLVDHLFEAQSRTRPDAKEEVSKDKILLALTGELDKVFKNVSKGYMASDAKPDVGGLLRTVDTDNSFTNERGQLIAPQTFYDYGLTFDLNRISRAHSAAAYYTLQFAGKNGHLDQLKSAIEKTKNDYERQIRAMVKGGMSEGEAQSSLATETKKQQLDGKLLLTYEQADDALRQVNNLKLEMERLLMRTGGTTDPEAMTAAASVQNFAVANLLSSVTSRLKHLFGGLGNLMLVHKLLLGRSATLGAVELAFRTGIQGVKELGAMTGPIGRALSDTFAAKQDQHRRMEQLGLAPTANVLQDLAALIENPTGAGRSRIGSATATQKILRTGESALRAVSIPLSAVTTRPVDRLLNVLSSMKADDVISMLRENAVRYGDKRDGLGLRGVFTPQELFGSRFATDKQALMLRNVFHKLALNVDTLMWNYRDGVASAKTGGKDPNKVDFFSPEYLSAFQHVMAQSISLPVFGNRPAGSKGSKGRNAIGLFWGFPAWQASRYSQFLSRASTDKTMLKHTPSLVIGAFTLAAMGAASLAAKNTASKYLYGESPSVGSILDAKDNKDAAVALASGFASYMPFFVGALLNGVILNTPSNTGFDVNSQFVMLNLANDMYTATKKMVQEHSVERPLLEFMRRWSPLSRVVINALPVNEGLTQYYNTARDLKNLAPGDMPSRKRSGGAADATPTTPIVQDMVNAAYRGDQRGFLSAADRFLMYEQSQGKSAQDAEQSLRASFRAHNPFILEFGRLPTQAEEATIYANASPEQRKGIDKSVQVFQDYGQMLGIQQPETKELKPDTGVIASVEDMGQGSGGGSLAVGSGGGSLRDTGGNNTTMNTILGSPKKGLLNNAGNGAGALNDNLLGSQNRAAGVSGSSMRPLGGVRGGLGSAGGVGGGGLRMSGGGGGSGSLRGARNGGVLRPIRSGNPRPRTGGSKATALTKAPRLATAAPLKRIGRRIRRP